EAAKNCGYVGIGSSLKFCIVAEGRADIYPRLSPTSEWDTAAGHAVLLAAGGRVDGPDGAPLAFGKRPFLNRGFVATGGWKAVPIGSFLEPFSGGGEIPGGFGEVRMKSASRRVRRCPTAKRFRLGADKLQLHV